MSSSKYTNIELVDNYNKVILTWQKLLQDENYDKIIIQEAIDDLLKKINEVMNDNDLTV